MRILRALLLPVMAVSLSGYTFDYTKSPVVADSTRWQTNTAPGGSVSFNSTGVAFSGNGGSLISMLAISGTNSNDYEISTTLAIKSGGGTYIQFFRAGSLDVHAGTGNYVSVELVPPVGFTSPGAATLNINRSSGGSVTQLGSTTITASDGMVLESVIWDGNMYIFANNICITWVAVPTISGTPGIGGYGINADGSGFTSMSLGPHSTTAPGAVLNSTIASSVFPTTASLRWQPASAGTDGVPVFEYQMFRDGNPVGYVIEPEFVDTTLQASTSHTYQILAGDMHGNWSGSATNFTVSTPPAQSIDPRRVGVFTTGSYWGGGGEQLDTLSGNLNFTVPLLAAQGRTSWSVPLGLSYNSQNWRQEGMAPNQVNWQLGDDVGYGFGWKAQLGSITPYYAYWWAGVDHYVFEDGTGAQYRLDQNNGGVWSSLQGIYVWFDANANVLHFKDGTFWSMGCTSGGTEADAGTLYPTLLEDTNGNQVIVTYLAGAGLPSGNTNTSARISTIEDVRGKGSASYTFSWNSDAPTPHLTGITNALGTAETYTFSIVGGQMLEPPFGSDPYWTTQTTAHLMSVTPAVGPAYTFTYDTAGAAELLQVNVPSGGNLWWTYGNDAYVGTRQLRAVTGRAVAADAAGATRWNYGITWDDASAQTIHGSMTLTDASGVGAKTWNFIRPTNPSLAWQVGLASQYVQSASAGGAVLSRTTYTWAVNVSPNPPNPYIATTATTLDVGTANQTTSTAQTVDNYGNVLTQQVFDYGNSGTPIRTYTNTYLHTSNSSYDNAYLRNRLVSTTVQDNQSNSATLVSNTYDGGSLAAVTGTPTEWDSVQGRSTNLVRGNVTQTVSPGSTVNYSYDVTGHMVTGSNAASGTGATLTYSSATNFAAPDAAAPVAGMPDAQNGHVPTQVSSSALAGSFSYNGALALVSSVMPNSATSSQTISPTTGLLTSSTSVHGATTNYTYAFGPTVITATTNSHWSESYKDGFGRDLAVEAGYGSTVVSVTQTLYGPCACSPLGKAAYISLPYASTADYGTPGAVATASDGTHTIGWNSYVYDGLGRTLTQTAPDTSATNYVYLGNTVKVTDPAGNWKRYTNNALGNLTQVEEPNPANGQSDNVATNFVTTYTYDVEGHLLSVAMPRPNGGGTSTQTRLFTYDLPTGKLTSAQNPENGTVSYAYYPDGLLKSKTDAKGQKVLYSYDGYGRLAYVDRYTDATTWDYCHSAALTYDTSSGGANGLGRLSSAVTGNAEACSSTLNETYTYTPGGLITSKGYQIGFPMTYSPGVEYAAYGYGPTATYRYDTEGHMTGYNGFSYTLDAIGRPTALTETGPGTVWVQNAAYGPAGEMQTMQYRSSSGSYFTENRTYNNPLLSRTRSELADRY